MSVAPPAGPGRLGVWAPRAGRVELCTPAGRGTMCEEGGGWWVLDGAPVAPGARYGFSLDGGPVRPDPRSPSQPDGVDGWSAAVDHSSFGWSDAGWRGLPLAGAVLYEIHIGTFSPAGTFDAAVAKLPHLVELGVDAVEVMPVAEFPGRRGWGYDGVDLFAPHHAYGGPQGLKRFVDACHGVGLAVVLDVVYNHFGPSGNYLPEFGPYLSDRHTTNWGAAVNFDGPGSDEVRRFVIDNALMWLRDYHLDGLRLDAVHAIVDSSARHLLAELASEVQALAGRLGRHKFVIAENDLNDPRVVLPAACGGYGLDAVWADEWHHALHAVLTGETAGYYEDFGTLEALAKALRQGWVHDGGWSRHRRRTFGASPSGLPGSSLVVCTQNHDQVGNRAAGERTSALVSEGKLRVAAALLLTSPFTPLLFQGEEWGASAPFLFFTDHTDPDLGRKVTAGRRAEFAGFGWDPHEVADPQAVETFDRSKLHWGELSVPRHRGLLDWYRHLIALRRRVPVLRDPRPSRASVDYDETSKTLRVERGDGVAVLANLGTSVHRFPSGGRDLLAASDPAVRCDGRATEVPPDAVAVAAAPRVAG